MASVEVEFVARPFEGLAGERDWVALREVVPSATATTRLSAAHGGQEITVATILPNLVPAWRRLDGHIMLALQTSFVSGDASRDLGQALAAALDIAPGEVVPSIDIAAPGPRLQDLIDPAADFTVTVQSDFAFWIDPEADDADVEEIRTAAERAAEVISPTLAVEGLESAYWTRLAGREFLRWSLGIDEEALLDALARLQAKRQAGILDGAKYAGAFRACGLVIPVWELPRGTEADELAEPGALFAARLAQALAVTDPLTSDERRARAGIVARSVTLR